MWSLVSLEQFLAVCKHKPLHAQLRAQYESALQVQPLLTSSHSYHRLLVHGRFGKTGGAEAFGIYSGGQLYVYSSKGMAAAPHTLALSLLPKSPARPPRHLPYLSDSWYTPERIAILDRYTCREAHEVPEFLQPFGAPKRPYTQLVLKPFARWHSALNKLDSFNKQSLTLPYSKWFSLSNELRQTQLRDLLEPAGYTPAWSRDDTWAEHLLNYAVLAKGWGLAELETKTLGDVYDLLPHMDLPEVTTQPQVALRNKVNKNAHFNPLLIHYLLQNPSPEQEVSIPMHLYLLSTSYSLFTSTAFKEHLSDVIKGESMVLAYILRALKLAQLNYTMRRGYEDKLPLDSFFVPSPVALSNLTCGQAMLLAKDLIDTTRNWQFPNIAPCTVRLEALPNFTTTYLPDADEDGEDNFVSLQAYHKAMRDPLFLQHSLWGQKLGALL